MINNAITFYMGIYGTVINFFLGWKNGVNMNPFTYEWRVILALFLRWLFGIMNNYCTYRSVQLIPLSKSIIIFSLNPFCCAILGSIFLKEHVNKTTIFWIFGAWLGIYLLTINKQESEIEDGSILGYILVILSTWFSAGIFICLRYLSMLQVKMQLPSFWVGLSFLFEGIFWYIFFDDLITISQYKAIDGIWMNAMGLMFVLWIATMFYANKYAITGQVAPIMNIENIYTILIDIFYFQYIFVATDIIGMLILITWILIPIVMKIIGERKSS